MGLIRDSCKNFTEAAGQRLRNIGDSIVHGIPDAIADWRDYGKPQKNGCLWTVIKWIFLVTLILGMLQECGFIDTDQEKAESSTMNVAPTTGATSDIQIRVPVGNFGKGEYDPYRYVEPRENILPEVPQESKQSQHGSDSPTEWNSPSEVTPDSIQDSTAQVAERLLPFLASPLRYAEAYGIELNRFPKEEKALAKWLEEGNYDQVFLDWDISWNNLLKNRFKRTEKRSEFVYCGDLKDNRPDGYGVLLQEYGQGNRFIEDGDHCYDLLYIGEFKEGKFDGFGLAFVSLTNGYYSLMEVCPYDEDSAEFTNYYLTWINRVSYMGEFSNGSKNGRGNEFDIVGAQYGSFVEDLDTQRYLIDVGEFRRGELNGYGRLYAAEKMYYEGELKDGLMHGKGKRYYLGSDQLVY